jgi:glycerol-3-phosphate acyltransferase PlsY
MNGGTVVLWTAIAFVAGSLPFSVWLPRLALRADVRRFGDGNPGSANAWKAGGWRVGLPALLLDYFKGAVPVSLAHYVAGLTGWMLVPVALAPVMGHAFSPFLRFRGGKALAVTFGVWTGLMLGTGPLILGLFFTLFYLVQSNDGWATLLGMVAFLGFVLMQGGGLVLLLVWGGNTLVLTWKHRRELRQPIQPRPWVGRFVDRLR